MRELGVTVWYMGLFGGQGCKDIPQAREGLIDAAGLLLMLALHLTPCQPLTAPNDNTFGGRQHSAKGFARQCQMPKRAWFEPATDCTDQHDE